MRRRWLLLATVVTVLSVVSCSTHQRPVPSMSATNGSAAGRAPLQGSFLIDLTWVGDQRGWALAGMPCGRGLCPRIAMTDDGGRAWKSLPAPPVGIPGPNGSSGCALEDCVSSILFATDQVGYLFGPALFQTDDGGRAWRRVASQPVEALSAAASVVVRDVYDHGGCPGPCNRTVQEADAGSSTWHTIFRIPLASADGDASAQIIQAGGNVIYIPAYSNIANGSGRTVIFRSTDGGHGWQRLADPCFQTGQPRHDTTAVAAGPRGFLAVLCLPVGAGTTFVMTSADNGSSWSPPHQIPGGTRDHVSQIAAAAENLIVANGGVAGSGPYTYRLLESSDGGLRWTTAITGTTQINPQASGANFLSLAGGGAGYWISDVNHIWATSDGGKHWLRRGFP